MLNRIGTAIGIVLLGCVGFVGYSWLQARVTTEVYRERLGELSDDFEDLRQHYNEAITKTAVTELLVEDDSVCVVIRRADGKVQQVPTPYRAGAQVYVDYVVIDGRLWIRRVFDDRTAPEKGVVIDPALADIDWEAPAVAVGKAVSRRLTEGRWVVTVTGDGSLGLAKADRPVELITAPPLGEYQPMTEQAQADVQRIGPTDVLRRAWGGG